MSIYLNGKGIFTFSSYLFFKLPKNYVIIFIYTKRYCYFIYIFCYLFIYRYFLRSVHNWINHTSNMEFLGFLAVTYENFFSSFSEILPFCEKCFSSGINWLYTFVDTFLNFSYSFICSTMHKYLSDESLEIYHRFLWRLSADYGRSMLYWSMLSDQITDILLYDFKYNQDWFRFFLASKEGCMMLTLHPETVFFSKAVDDYLYNETIANAYISIIVTPTFETFCSATLKFCEIFFLVYFVLLCLFLHTTYYNVASNEESFVDADYFNANLLVESEKELGSLDDILLGVVFLFYVFGWYFFTYSLLILQINSGIDIVYFSLPIFIYIVLSVPIYLLYTFGMYFLLYLRGAGATSVLLVELLYDYIAITAFWVRLSVQGVRLLLMAFTYASLHDIILFNDFSMYTYSNYEVVWENNINYFNVTYRVSYYFLFILPIKIVHWLYELFHTFFVLSVQITALFAMIFWLFLFLYTFFVLEKHEDYFKSKRQIKKEKIEQLLKVREEPEVQKYW